MHRFLVVIEQADGNYSAYSPDLPGCAATGKNRKEVEENIRAAIEMHVQGLVEDGQPVPVSGSIAEYITIKEEIGSGQHLLM
ncbi:MAG: type II toxin-antitoxin system HicB family antitoxin [Gemmatimonadetes bacterium]|nr:type II toxin-antitoxin system HicB family antitoxin [Gemmatimonadota bacterium]